MFLEDWAQKRTVGNRYFTISLKYCYEEAKKFADYTSLQPASQQALPVASEYSVTIQIQAPNFAPLFYNASWENWLLLVCLVVYRMFIVIK